MSSQQAGNILYYPTWAEEEPFTVDENIFIASVVDQISEFAINKIVEAIRTIKNRRITNRNLINNNNNNNNNFVTYTNPIPYFNNNNSVNSTNNNNNNINQTYHQ